jgi:hypothetical protein
MTDELVRCKHTGQLVACPKPLAVREIAAAASRILKAQRKIPPAERFRRMVESGLIDTDGRLRKAYGGEAP